MKTEKKIAVLTGGSSGIGLAAANELSKDYTVYELSRRDFAPENFTHIKADVTKEEELREIIDGIAKKEGRIDLLVCCAGFGISGAVEFTEGEDAKRQIGVNFFGTDNAVRAVLPCMRKQQGGRILCVSSVAAPVVIPFQTYYSVSKAAINAYVEGLALEVKPFGISVCAVMPGDISTGFTAARKKSTKGDDLYNGRISRSVSGMEKDEQNGGSPEYAGKFIARLAKKRKIPVETTIGFSYKLVVLCMKLAPKKLGRWAIYKLYAK